MGIVDFDFLSIRIRDFQLLEDIEEHLGVTIPQIDTDFIVPVDEFDGKVVYGAKRANTGTCLACLNIFKFTSSFRFVKEEDAS